MTEAEEIKLATLKRKLRRAEHNAKASSNARKDWEHRALTAEAERDALKQDAELYRHLRDHFTKNLENAREEFARLEPLTGAQFDAVVRASIDAMGVEPVAAVLNGHYQQRKDLEEGVVHELFTRPAPPPADHIGDATTMGAERAAMCYRLKEMAKAMTSYGYAGCTELCIEAADMLAADAQEIERKYISPVRTVADLANNLLLMDQTMPIYGAQYIDHPTRGRCAIAVSPTVTRERVQDSRWIGQGNELNAAIVWTRAAQQVAVPQDSALLDHLQQSGSTVEILPGGNSGTSWSFRIGGLHAAVHHDIRAAIGLAMLAAVPQPPQADALAADHAEDVRAMVPMTDQELNDLLPTNDSMSRADSLRWMARATERHHKIGVKQ